MKKPHISLLLLGAGILLLVAGVVLKTTQDQQAANNKPIEVKEQSIPLSVDDFDAEDPRIQGAVRQQLQQQEGSVQTTGENRGNNGDAQLLQPVPQGVQGELKP
jgi:hypothetical protein